MAFEYHFREFSPDTRDDEISEWLEKMGEQNWEAVNFAAVTHTTGGGLIGGIAIPSTQRSGYTFLLKREKK